MLIARGDDLSLLVDLANLQGHELVLDVGTAAGTAALTVAGRTAGPVVGVDMSPALVEQAGTAARKRGLGNVRFQLGDAGALPFTDDRFDLVVSRMAGHHFPDVGAFCREAARVLKPGGRVVVLDNVAPEAPELDEYINALERLRDPDHVRARRVSEWLAALQAADLAAEEPRLFRTPEPLPDWWERLGVSVHVAAEIHHRLAEAPAAVREAFWILPDSFCLHRAAFSATK